MYSYDEVYIVRMCLSGDIEISRVIKQVFVHQKEYIPFS